ncbi:MAG: SUF system NifU family Fe-S cluster assembly protein [Nanoarchaeota archaeon]|nr:SUF system NifU family Fe-S cluster assembly protein [Nanoarchaeota archaeon]
MNLEMYKEHILDLYKNPHNKGELENFTHSFAKDNPLCGDEIKIQLIIKKNKIADVRFNGIGCVISNASASMLTDRIKKMEIEKIKKLAKEDILKMLKIPISPARIKCALLPLDAVRGALGKNA